MSAVSEPRTSETCAYPQDRDGEHDHADCKDALAQEAIDAADIAEVRDVAEMTEQATVAHDWYHDGVLSHVHGRLCRTCRFRERRDGIADQPCLGSARLYEAAREEGYAAGLRAERARMRQFLGL